MKQIATEANPIELCYINSALAFTNLRLLKERYEKKYFIDDAI